jgi:hypothetical protein
MLRPEYDAIKSEKPPAKEMMKATGRDLRRIKQLTACFRIRRTAIGNHFVPRRSFTPSRFMTLAMACAEHVFHKRDAVQTPASPTERGDHILYERRQQLRLVLVCVETVSVTPRFVGFSKPKTTGK